MVLSYKWGNAPVRARKYDVFQVVVLSTFSVIFGANSLVSSCVKHLLKFLPGTKRKKDSSQMLKIKGHLVRNVSA